MQVQTSNATDSWQRVKTRLRDALGDDAYQNWFGGVTLEENSGTVVKLSVPTRFLKNWIQSNYEKQLVGLWQTEIENICKIELTVRGALRPKNNQSLIQSGSGTMRTPPARARFATRTLHTSAQETPLQNPAPLTDSDDKTVLEFLKGAPLSPRLTFETFVSGCSNSTAVETARQIANGHQKNENLLYVHSGVGHGKTHLLHAIAQEARRQGRFVSYMSAEYFMYHLVPALKSRSAPAVRQMLSTLDLLLIDDMQFLHGKQVRSEFCGTLQQLIEPVSQVVVAADRPPEAIDTLEPALQERFANGQVIRVGAPEFDLRLGILNSRLEAAKHAFPAFDIPDDVLTYIARNITTSGRDLEGAINRLLAHHQLTGQSITVTMSVTILKDLLCAHETRPVLIEHIQQTVCKHYNVSKNDMLSSCRARNLVGPRQIAMYLSKMMTARSLPEIGKRFGGRDHTTVLHAVRKIEARIENEPEFGTELALLKQISQECVAV